MTDPQNSLHAARFTERLVDSTLIRQIPVLDVELLALAAGLAPSHQPLRLPADAELAFFKAARNDVPSFPDPILDKHSEAQHLTAEAVGKLCPAPGSAVL